MKTRFRKRKLKRIDAERSKDMRRKSRIWPWRQHPIRRYLGPVRFVMTSYPQLICDKPGYMSEERYP